MFPFLSDLINYLFGVYIPLPIATFGFMVGVSFLLANTVFRKEMARRQQLGIFKAETKKIVSSNELNITELIYNSVFGFIIGFKVVPAITNYKEFASDPQSFLLSTTGNINAGVIGLIAFAAYGYYEYYKRKNNPITEKEVVVNAADYVLNMTFIAGIAGILGAKLFHNLENINEFINDPIDALLSFSGLTMYGGLICGAIAVLYYANKNKLSMIDVADSCAPGLMLAYGTGRIGCHLSGDGDWGIENTLAKPFSFMPDWFWSFKYPNNVLGEGVPIPGCVGKYCAELPVGVFPTAMYEAIVCILLFCFLWYIRKRIKVSGVMFSLYLLLNGIERFGIESIRVNTKYNILGGITQAQIISSVLILLGICGIIYFKRKNQKT